MTTTSDISLTSSHIFVSNSAPAQSIDSPTFPLPTFPDAESRPSALRQVFKTNESSRNQFFKIFELQYFAYDEKEILDCLDKLLSDTTKTDEAIYNELCNSFPAPQQSISLWISFYKRIICANKVIAVFFKSILAPFKTDNFQNYLSIGELYEISWTHFKSKFTFKGTITALCDTLPNGLFQRIKFYKSLFSPYTSTYPNNPDSLNNFLDESQDVVNYNGPFCSTIIQRHADSSIVNPIKSIVAKLRPGGLFSLSTFDHEQYVRQKCAQQDINPANIEMTSLIEAHTLLESARKKSTWETHTKYSKHAAITSEEKDNFTMSLGLTKITPGNYDLPQPYYSYFANRHHYYIKTPSTLEELKRALSDRNDYTQSSINTRSAFLQEGYRRSSEDYVNHIQTKHAFTFDYVGHLRQHYTHFYHFVKECLMDKDVKKRDLIFSGGMAMNLFLLAIATVHNSLAALSSLPQACFAKWKHGDKWRDVASLNELETLQAAQSAEYLEFSRTHPFYRFDHLQVVKALWHKTMSMQITNSVKIAGYVSTAMSSISLLIKAGVSIPLKWWNKGTVTPQETIKIVVKDKKRELAPLIDQWNEENPAHAVRVLLGTKDETFQTLVVHNNQPFINFCDLLLSRTTAKITEVCGQESLYINLLGNDQPNWMQKVYEVKALGDPENRTFATYKILASNLKAVMESHGSQVAHIYT